MGLTLGDKFINIQTSNKSGKYHYVKCPYCNVMNKISLEQIKAKKEFDDFVKQEAYRNKTLTEQRAIRPSFASFYCGNQKCQQKLTTTITDGKDSMIYTNMEYNKEVTSLADSLSRKQVQRTSKESLGRMLKG